MRESACTCTHVPPLQKRDVEEGALVILFLENFRNLRSRTYIDLAIPVVELGIIIPNLIELFLEPQLEDAIVKPHDIALTSMTDPPV